MSVFIPGEDIISGKLDLMQVLNSINSNIIKLKQKAIELLAPRLQYAIPPIHLLYNKSDDTQWDPPFKDAVDMTIDGMFRRANNMTNNQPTNIPRVVLSEQGWRDRYKSVHIAIPSIPIFEKRLTYDH